VIAKQAGHALHILDRFHIVQHMNQAVDEVRRAESTRLRGTPIAAKLKKMRWKLLRRGSRVRGQARIRLYGLLESKMATGRAWDLKECFHYFWHYSPVSSIGHTRGLKKRPNQLIVFLDVR
jgi:transposase